MLTLGHKVLLLLGTNCKLHRDDSERITILILHTEYIMLTVLASSKLTCVLQKRTCLNRRLHLKSTAHAPPQPEKNSAGKVELWRIKTI